MDNYEAYLWECRKLEEAKKKRELEERHNPSGISGKSGTLGTSGTSGIETTSIPWPNTAL